MLGFLAVLCSVLCVFSARLFLKAYYEENFVKGFWLKGAAALSFVLVGFALLAWKGSGVNAELVVCGLVLGLVGDQLLAMRLIHKNLHDPFFIAGALSFGVGHVLYILFLSKTEEVKLKIVLPVLLIGLLLSLVYARKSGTDVKEKTPLAAVYIALVLLMASTAVSVAFMTGTLSGVLFALGGILFSLSDNILCAYCYGKNPVWKMNRDLHVTYYGAQLAIAWSILFL